MNKEIRKRFEWIFILSAIIGFIFGVCLAIVLIKSIVCT